MEYPFVKFKSLGVTINKFAPFFYATCPTIIDSVRICNLTDEPNAGKLTIIKKEQENREKEPIKIWITAGTPLLKWEGRDVLEGSVLYMEKGDYLKGGMSSYKKTSIFISYRELMNQQEDKIFSPIKESVQSNKSPVDFEETESEDEKWRNRGLSPRRGSMGKIHTISKY